MASSKSSSKASSKSSGTKRKAAAGKGKAPAKAAKRAVAAKPFRAAKSVAKGKLAFKAAAKVSPAKFGSGKNGKSILRPARSVAAKNITAAPAGQHKGVKSGSGLSKSELEHFRQLLLEKRREIIGDVGSMESEAFKGGQNLSNMPIHMADVGTDNFEQEFTLGLIESERQLLREIQDALGRMEDGSFGICIATGKPIGKARLEAKPWAKHSIEYTRMLEQGLIRHDADANEEEEAAGGDEEEE